jgi:hypothetical protein
MSEKIEGSSFGWDDTVRIIATAPPKFRPGELGNVVGWVHISNDVLSREYDEPHGSLLLTIEWYDGSSAQVPVRFLELVEEGR